MNNKITVRKFWQMGGRVEIELYPEVVRSIGEQQYLFIAGSKESFKEVWKNIEEIYEAFSGKYHVDRGVYHIIRNIHVGVDGISYEAFVGDNLPYMLRKEVDFLDNDFYLKACGKYYRGLG